jgi:hypothetical protein
MFVLLLPYYISTRQFCNFPCPREGDKERAFHEIAMGCCVCTLCHMISYVVYNIAVQDEVISFGGNFALDIILGNSTQIVE